jgi:hypothetical protein
MKELLSRSDWSPLRRYPARERAEPLLLGAEAGLTESAFSRILIAEPKWRNWQTRTTQTRVSFAHVGSIPTFGICVGL